MNFIMNSECYSIECIFFTILSLGVLQGLNVRRHLEDTTWIILITHLKTKDSTAATMTQPPCNKPLYLDVAQQCPLKYLVN